MSASEETLGMLRRFVGVAGRDAGCIRGMDVIDLYVEAEIAGLDAARRYPGVAVHLEACPDCAQDHDGLVALVRAAEGGRGS